jgi:hypothetical protein
MYRRLLMASTIAVVVAAAFAAGSGATSSRATVRGIHGVPAGLAAAIHTRLGAGAIRSSSGAAFRVDPLLGYSVALSADGTTALVGARGAGGIAGAAYIFHSADAGSWSSQSTPTATLTKSGVGALGLAVALSQDGTTAFVGAVSGGGSPSTRGRVFVFQVAAEDAWSSSSTPKATLKMGEPGLGLFPGNGLAVSADGCTLVVGVPYDHSLNGGADVFHVSSESAWASTATPAAALSNAAETIPASDFAGYSVAISGDGTTVLVNDVQLSNAGSAYLYHVSSADSWTSSSTPTAILTDTDGGVVDSPGYAVALSGDGTVALVGAPDVSAGDAGVVDVFHSSGEGAWISTSTPTAVLTGPSGINFGEVLTLSSDGKAALVFSPFVHGVRGATYIFQASGEGAWASSSTPTATLTNSAGIHGDSLGDAGALSADGATVLAGAPGVDSNTGAADVFHVADESSWATSSTPNAIVTDTALAHCVVPKLKGLPIDSAEFALVLGRCKVGKISKVHVTAKKRRGRVLSQSKKPGRRLAIGAKVNVKIGK